MEKMETPVERFRESNIFITGATGLIGSVLTEYLLDINEKDNLKLKLFLLIRDKKKLLPEILNEAGKGNVKIIEGDINRIPRISEKIDYVIHGASITESRMMIKNPVEVIKTNLNGTINCLELSREKNVKAMIYLSSMEIYGFTKMEVLLTEENVQYLNPLALRSSYPESKRMSENLCVSYAAEYGVPVKIIRLAQTFGQGVKENDTRVFAEFGRCAKDETDIHLKSDGQSRRMYLDSKDAVRAILTVLLNGKTGEAYNAGNKDTYCSIREMAEFVASEIAGGKIKVRFDVEKNTENPYSPSHCLLLDISKLEGLGWQATAGLKEMYTRMMNGWKKKKGD